MVSFAYVIVFLYLKCKLLDEIESCHNSGCVPTETEGEANEHGQIQEKNYCNRKEKDFRI